MAEEYTVNFNLVQDAARTAALQTAGGQVAGAGAIGGQSPQQRRDNQQAASQRQQSILKLIGVELKLAALLKNSQLFTNTLGALFQIVGGFFDVALAPLMPLIASGLSSMAKFIPVVAQVSQATLPRLVALIAGVGRTLAGIAGALGNVFRPVINLFDKDGVSADGRLRLSDIITGLGAAALGPGVVAALQTGSKAIIGATVFNMMGGTVSRLSSFVRSAGFIGLIFSGVNIASTFAEQGIESGLKALMRFFIQSVAAALGAAIGSMFGIVGTIVGALGGAAAGGMLANMLMGSAGTGVVGAEVNQGGRMSASSDYAETMQMQEAFPVSANAGVIGSNEGSLFGTDREVARMGGSG
tara:strand:+ start:1894 stop:2961 length:1068 start_codon:yes stop_codon:yes gene_type:complete